MKNLELPFPPEMSARARAAEISAILAAAIVRTFVALQPTESAVELGFLPNQSVHTTPYQQETLL